jgi:tRNA-splicing ligase RtcB
MSRQKATDSMAVSGVTLIGATVEEHPLAYKAIETMIAAQQDWVDIQGKFYPRIVRMNKE